MFGLDTLIILGVVAITGAAAAGGGDNNNDRHRRGPSFNNTSSNFSSSSSSSSSVHANTSYLEKRTIWDWWANGLTGGERDILLGWGYSDEGTRYSLKELKDEVKYRERNLLNEESQVHIQVWMGENDYSSGEEKRKNERIINPPKRKSPAWKGMKHHKGDIKTNGKSGSEKRFYRWDNKHNDIEVYNRHGKHLGSMDPRTGKMYRGPDSTNTITHLL